MRLNSGPWCFCLRPEINVSWSWKHRGTYMHNKQVHLLYAEEAFCVHTVSNEPRRLVQGEKQRWGYNKGEMKSAQPLTVVVSVIAPHHYVFFQTSDVSFFSYQPVSLPRLSCHVSPLLQQNEATPPPQASWRQRRSHHRWSAARGRCAKNKTKKMQLSCLNAN